MSLASIGSAQSADRQALWSLFLMNVEADLDETQVVGARRIVPVTGGSFAGPRLNGVVLSGGGDWLVGRPDGTSELDVRVTLQTDDDQLIYARYSGLIHTPEGREMYFRT